VPNPIELIELDRARASGGERDRVQPSALALAYTANGVAGPETTTRDGSQRAVWLVALPLGAYALALFMISAAVPYAPALDDPEWGTLARYFAAHGELDPGGLFRRVPLWQILLGSGVALIGERAAVVGLQALCVAAVLGGLAWRAKRGLASERATLGVALAFALSPQALLYSRHAATELAIGALACGIWLLASQTTLRAAAWAGAAAGAATMIKLAALVAGLTGVLLVLQVRDRRASRLAAFAAGFALVVIPLVVLAVAQRGWPLDDTSSFNLSRLDQDTWLAAGSVAIRNELALESFRSAWGEGAGAYLAAAAGRAGGWLMRPSSLDLLTWIPSYPALWVELGDHVLFFGGLTLALLGTTRSSWPLWLLPIAFWLACSFPLKTPYSPKVAALIPLLLLAPLGIDSLRRRPS